MRNFVHGIANDVPYRDRPDEVNEIVMVLVIVGFLHVSKPVFSLVKSNRFLNCLFGLGLPLAGIEGLRNLFEQRDTLLKRESFRRI